MDILLINPYTFQALQNQEYYPPPSLFYLSEILLEHNINVEVLDLNTHFNGHLQNKNELSKRCIIEKIKKKKPDLIGITCLFSGHMEQVICYSQTIKSNFKDIGIVIGGIHPTIFYNDILSNIPEIDYIVLGEGEETIIALVDALDNNKKIDDIKGLVFRKNDKIIINKKCDFIKDLDRLPFPKYKNIDIKKYYVDTSAWNNPKKLEINMSLPIISSRGCPMNCNFCSMFLVNGRQCRYRNIKKVVDEIEFLNKSYNCNHFSFYDDNLTLNKNRIKELYSEILKRKLNIQFETPNGLSIRTLDEDIINMLVELGLTRISLAIESGDDFIRNKIMKKNVSREKIYDVIKICKKHKNLKIRAYFIMGMPEDTKTSLENTYNMIREIDINKPQVTNLLPYPGTKVFEQCVNDGLFFDNNFIKNLWKTNKMYMAGNKDFFVKPYRMSLPELIKYRKKFDVLINEMIIKNNG